MAEAVQTSRQRYRRLLESTFGMTRPSAMRTCRLQNRSNVTRSGLLLLVTLAACPPRTVPYNDVRITSDPAVPERYMFLGEVTGGGNTLTGVGTSTGTTAVEASAPQDPIAGLRQATADFGGNTVVVTSSGDSLAGSSITGDAYDCRGYNPQ